MRRFLIHLIKAYQYFLSPFLGSSCRFTPSCSCYASESIEKFGAMKGCWLAIKRLGRCHPFHEGGFDPVPEKHSTKERCCYGKS